ncbi:unnamed protein product [Sphagnum balticum]
MVGVDLVRECQRCIAKVADEVEGGILYVDSGAGEALHFIGGLPFILQLGVRAVCSLENASPLDAVVAWRPGELRKVVVLTTQLLSDAHRYILRCLRCHPAVRHCTVFTSISQDAHSACPETPLGTDSFREYTSLLLQDLQLPSVTPKGDDASSYVQGDMESTPSRTGSTESDGRPGLRLSITVEHLPMMLCPLTKGVFVLPSGSAEAEAPLSDNRPNSSLGPGLPAIDTGVPLDGDDYIPSGATLLAHMLQHFTAQLELKVEVFSLGPLAQIVGKMVTGLASPIATEHGAQKRSAGLLLVDRSLDLITPSCHNDVLLDRVFSSLPRRPAKLRPPHPPGVSSNFQSCPVVRRPVDFRVPTKSYQDGSDKNSSNVGLVFPLFPIMSSWDTVSQGKKYDSSKSTAVEGKTAGVEVMGGSLAVPWDQLGVDRVNSLLEKSTKDGTVLLRKWLHEAWRLEKQTIRGKGRLGTMTLTELASLRTGLASKPDMALRHLSLLQVAQAVEEALSTARWSEWEALASAERILRLTAGDGSQSLALQLRDMVQQTSSDNMLDLTKVLTLAIVGYALAGETTPRIGSSGPFAWEEEAVLKESLVDAILQGPPRGADLGFLRGLDQALDSHWHRLQSGGTESLEQNKEKSIQADEEWEKWEGVDGGSEEGEEFNDMQLKLELRDRLQEVVNVLHRVAAARARLPLPLRSSEEQNGAMPSSLLQRIFSLTFSKVDVPGLQHHSSAVGRFFKSGLGRFGLGQAKPKLGDQKLIIVFVIGGIQASEVRDIREAQVGAPGGDDVEVLIGGTTILTPADMYDLLLGSCYSV